MKDSSLKLLMIFSVFMASLAQVLLKIGSNCFICYQNIIYILTGILIYGFSTIIHLFVLSKKELSWTYSFVGLSYIFVNLFSLFINEEFSIFKFVGSTLIAIGVAFVAST
ncbi:MAG: hypothetical protein ACP5HJ_02135 [Candidatus Micrarchaeia archaeon]